ncbi:MAG TPA: hypothetical protein DDY14_10625 [Chromatiaceae bacterium]|nr:MAG: hypothetical protein N838_11610 [Thiohalocapsa sp. PB-PSB1]HBG95748.1 hypothetical protein [Chromatiaceae bacterium]HCS91045.1 hypothetical protein [Chromatiaceae bacterium]
MAINRRPPRYDLHWDVRHIRLIVLDAVADAPRDVLWELFSRRIERVRRGLNYFYGGRKTAATQQRLWRLFVNYPLGPPAMTCTIDDCIRATHASDCRRDLDRNRLNCSVCLVQQ